MKLRFQADANFKYAVIAGVRQLQSGIDIRAAQGAIPDGTSDIDVLALASTDQRTLLTHDVRTMTAQFVHFRRNRQSPGVILVPQKWPVPIIIEGIVRSGRRGIART